MDKYKTFREWANLICSVLAIIFLFLGVDQLEELNINLKNFTADQAEIISLKSQNASLDMIKTGEAETYWNGSCLISKVGETADIMCY